MEDAHESLRIRDEVISSLSEIFSHIERLIDYLIQKRRDETGWLGILAATLTLVAGTISVFIVNFLADMCATKYFIDHPGSNIIYIGFLLVISFVLGLTTYFYAKKQYTKQCISWKNTLNSLRKTVDTNKAEETGIIETTLQLMDQISDWLPRVLQYKSEEAITYGFVAFLLVSFISANLPIALLSGVIVWLYFRYEKRKETEQDIQAFKAWKKKLEDGKGTIF